MNFEYLKKKDKLKRYTASLVTEMLNKRGVRALMDSQHVKGSETLLIFARQ